MMNARGVLFLFPFLMACGSKWDFEDGDGDGISAAEGDCWDKAEGPEGSGLSGSDIHPDAEETWYDGFDQNCQGDDDYDADADGFVMDEYVGLETFGLDSSGDLPPGDCWDSLAGPGDGSFGGELIHPDAADDWYDGVDSDCSGNDDYDQDGDGFVQGVDDDDTVVDHRGLETVPLADWEALPGGDCLDDPAGLEGSFDGESFIVDGGEIHPDAVEFFYDGVDQDCLEDNDYDQDIDGQNSAYHPDLDGEVGDDCLDNIDDPLQLESRLQTIADNEGYDNRDILDIFGLTEADIYLGAPDAPYDGLDSDCGGLGYDCDIDGDGFEASGGGSPLCIDVDPDAVDPICAAPVCGNDDCDDEDEEAFPNDEPEIPFNAIDDDCQPSTGDGDADFDGFWDINYAELMPSSELTPGVGEGGDCNDADSSQNPIADEVWYDGVDQDCGGDDDFDQDGDNFVPDEYVGAVTWWVVGSVEAEIDEPREGGNDCDDTNPLVNPHPLTNEDCATPYDDDCDVDTNDPGAEDCTPFFADRDDDGFGQPGDSTCFCIAQAEYTVEKDFGEDGTDCDDTSNTTWPGAAEFDSPSTACMKDDDADGFGDETPPSGVVAGADCDDDFGFVKPTGIEVCDAGDVHDEDCDGSTNDLDAVDATTFHADRDGDGFGDPADSEDRCYTVSVYTTEDNTDCDDTRSAVNPAASNELCSTPYDDDCDGDINDEDAEGSTRYYADVDDDGYGDPGDSEWHCDPEGIYNETDDDDCDDTRSAVNPAAPNELCSTPYDDDCDGDINDEDAEGSTRYYADVDADGYGDPGDSEWHCDPEGIYNETDDDDCDDSRSAVSPSGTETCATSYDDDCDGDTNDEGAVGSTRYYADVDGDGYGDPGDSELHCDPEGIYNETNNDDCDDSRSAVNPAAANELCSTPYDDDCDGDTNDEGAVGSTRYYADVDADGYGDPADSELHCIPEGIYNETDDDDCDDTRSSVSPSGTETCSTPYDDDCDGDINDEGAVGSTRYYADVDSDGYGDPGDSELHCDPVGIYNETDNDDCDDTRFAVKPSGTETCSTSYDDDCDGDTNDEGAVGSTTYYADVDGDGYGDPTDSEAHCGPEGIYNETDTLDCDDGDSAIYSGAPEVCDLVDSDCDGSLLDGGESDLDGDGDPDCADTDVDGDGFLATSDCDDFDDDIYPGAPELCDMIDSDCDGSIFDDTTDDDGGGVPDCLQDDDDDGYTADIDCDDTDPLSSPGVVGDDDSPEGVDNDCDGFIDEDAVLDAFDANAVLIFSEMQVNPFSPGNEKFNEWFEVTNVGSATLYLNNWLFENCNSSGVCTDFSIDPDLALIVNPDETLLFCFSSSTMDALLSTESCDYTYGSGSSAEADYFNAGYRLRNGARSALFVSVGGLSGGDLLVDSVDHIIAGFPSTSVSANEGMALMFDGDLMDSINADVDNDSGANWCVTEVDTYIYEADADAAGEHNRGTPGVVNPTCAVAAP